MTGSGADVPPPARPRFLPGDVLADRFTVVRYIACGGMGEVYEVEDKLLQGVHVALKTILPEIAEDGGSTRRFEQEVLLARKVTHPNLCPIYDIALSSDAAEPILFLTMKLLAGETLSARLKRTPAIAADEAMAIFRQVAAGVAAIHAAGVIHRDLKPNNIMLEQVSGDGGSASLHVSIMDFGLARLHVPEDAQETRTALAGTPGYIAPEMMRGEGPSWATDLYALGVVMEKVLASMGQAAIPADVRQAVKGLTSGSAEAREQAFADLQAALHGDPAAKPRRDRLFWSVVGVAGFVVVLVALLLIPSIGDRVRGFLFANRQKHIAVLPLDSTGGTPETQAIGDGLMDSLAGKLANLDTADASLFVIPASELRERKVTSATAAMREFGATIVVKGSFERTRDGAELRLNLIDPRKSREIGFIDLDNKEGDLTVLQDDAVARLVRLMDLRLKSEPENVANGTTRRAAYEDYLAGSGYFQRSDKPGNLDRAVESLRNALKTDPRFALGYTLITQVYLLKYRFDSNPKWLDAAGESSRTAAELADQLPETYVALAQYHQMTGKEDLAVVEYQRALSLDPRDVEAVNGIARLYEVQGRTADAEAAYKRAAALHPDNWKGYNDLGVFYDETGRPQQAIEQYRHAIQLTPDNAWPYGNLGIAYQNLDDPSLLGLAEEAFKHSLALDKNFAIYSDLGFLYMEQGRYQEALTANQEALEMNGQSADVWSNLAVVYQWLNDEPQAKAARERATALYRQAVKMNAQNPLAQAALALLYAKAGRNEQAMDAIHISLALSPSDPYVLLQVADAYESLGERTQAIAYVERALTLGLSRWQLRVDPYVKDAVSDPRFKYPARIAPAA